MPCAFLFSTAVLVTEDPETFGEDAGVVRRESESCSGKVDGERVQWVGNVPPTDTSSVDFPWCGRKED